jgi:hypothetical protein
VTTARSEVREGHPVGATNPGIHVMHLSRESVRWKPLCQGIGIKEGAIDAFRRCPDDPVKSDGICGHDQISILK